MENIYFNLLLSTNRKKKRNYWILLIKEKNMQGIWWRGIDRNARAKVICVRGGGERIGRGEGKATRGEKTRTLLILFHMHTSILCMQIFGTDNIVFAIDTPYKATMSRTDAPARIFPQNLQLTRIVKRAIFKVGEIILRNPVFNRIAGKGNANSSPYNVSIFHRKSLFI